MKRLIFSAALLVFAAGYASAQTTGSNSSNATSVNSSRGGTKTTKGKTGKKPSAKRDNSKVYQWKDGQRATPTGHEATSINGGYASLPKDSATQKPRKKQEKEK